MKKKIVLVAMTILLACSAAAFAASTFSLGAVGYYSYFDLEQENFDAYIPGIRAEFFFSEFLGVSVDAILNDEPFPDIYEMLYIADVVLRVPLGLIEPYVATGPAYRGFIVGDTILDPGEDAIAYNVRGGVDFNLGETFSVGVEANFMVNDVVGFIEDFSNLTPTQQEAMIKLFSKIGITAKYKF